MDVRIVKDQKRKKAFILVVIPGASSGATQISDEVILRLEKPVCVLKVTEGISRETQGYSIFLNHIDSDTGKIYEYPL